MGFAVTDVWPLPPLTVGAVHDSSTRWLFDRVKPVTDAGHEIEGPCTAAGKKEKKSCKNLALSYNNNEKIELADVNNFPTKRT